MSLKEVEAEMEEDEEDEKEEKEEKEEDREKGGSGRITRTRGEGGKAERKKE